jgi:hypothetical protein
MPKYRITSPDGKTYDITAPDGATQQQVMEFAQAQFGSQKKEPPPIQGGVDPTSGMGTGERFLAGIGKGMHDLYAGGKQALGLASQGEIDEKKRLDAPLMGTTAGTVGNVAGKVAAGLPAVFVPGANTVLGAAAIGAAQGALEPTATGESTVQNMLLGGAGGTAGVIAGRAIKAGAQGGKALLEPFTAAGQNRIAGRVLERFAADPAALRSATSAPTTTGALPTLAEAGRDTGIAALERSIAQQDPQIAARFLQRGADNNAARVGVLQQLAGTQADRAAAEAARKGATEGAYRAGTQATYTMDGELSDLLGRPAVRQAMERAKTMAANQGRPFAFDVAAPTGGEGVRKAGSQQITGQGLQDLKMALDEMLTDPASGFAGKAGDTIKGLRGQLLSWMEKANPEFKAAREGYAAASKPINAMDVGQRLLDKTTGAMRDMGGNQRLQANAFARALNDEQGLVRNATGFRGVNSLDDVLTPQQVGSLNALRSELELGANLSQAANGPGSQTAKSLASQNLLRQALGPTGLPQSWAESTLLESLLRPVQFGLKAAEPRIQNRLADILLDPAQARAAMDAAAPQQLSPALQRLLPYLQQAGQQSVPAALVSR